MGAVSRVIDTNAHVENLKSEIITEGGSAIAKISFTNLGFGDITAIKFNACGYNSFGDIVLVNGKEKFFLIIQDFVIPRNEKATELRVVLPDVNMKKLDLEECQICYADGSVVSYDGNNSLNLELEEIDDGYQLSALQKMFDINARFKPKECEQGWVCSCGRFNAHEKNTCSLCRKNKSEVIRACSEEGLRQLTEEYRISEEKDRENREVEQKRQNREKKKRKLIIGIGIVLCLVFACVVGRAVQLSHRTTFDSVSEMRRAMQGTWTHLDDRYTAQNKIHIVQDAITLRWVSLGIDLNFTIEEWNPQSGTFRVVNDTYVVLSNGNIQDEDGKVYRKGGTWSDNADEEADSFSYTSSYETAKTALEFSNIVVTSNSSYTVCTGTVTNNGKKTYDYVQIKGAFKDSSGTVLDTDWTYAVGSEGLAPGESTTFRMSVPKNINIKDCKITIMD